MLSVGSSSARPPRMAMLEGGRSERLAQLPSVLQDARLSEPRMAGGPRRAASRFHVGRTEPGFGRNGIRYYLR